jgi:hypothetical protein
MFCFVHRARQRTTARLLRQDGIGRDVTLEVMKEINSKVTVRPIASQTTPG